MRIDLAHALTLLLLLVPPFLILNSWFFYRCKLIEDKRPMEQVKEALQIYKECLNADVCSSDGNSQSHLASEHEIPSCSLISVLRAGQWRRLPHNLVVEGDILKLRIGDCMPCDAVPCTLTQQVHVNAKTHATERQESVTAVGGLWKQGEPFQVSRKASDAVGSVLAYRIFIALQTPCAAQVRRFLKRGARMSGGYHERHQTQFIERLKDINAHTIRPIGAFLCIVFVINGIVRCAFELVRGRSDPLMPDPPPFVMYSLDVISRLALIVLCVLPIVPRLIIDTTDLVGNARLQSLFLFHHERRYQNTHLQEESDKYHWKTLFSRSKRRKSGKDLKNPHNRQTFSSPDWVHKTSDAVPVDSSSAPVPRRPSSVSSLHTSAKESSSASWFSETGLSRPSSVDTELSISRVPILKQLQEIKSIFQQGLDGPSNLLHSLSSSTYLCFVDHEGLLTETCRKIEEIGFLAEEDTKPVVLALQATNIGEARREFDIMDSIHNLEIDAQASAAGIRFVDQHESFHYMDIIRPLAVAMRCTQLPPIGATEAPSNGWLYALRFWDFFQRELSGVAQWQSCLCALSRLTDLHVSGRINDINTIRNILAVSLCTESVQYGRMSASSTVQSLMDTSEEFSEELESACSTVENRTTTLDSPLYHHMMGNLDPEDLHVMTVALVKDLQDSRQHLFVKGRPQDVLTKSRFYYDGSEIRPMEAAMTSRLQAILMQWRSEGFEVFGFGYSPLAERVHQYLIHSLEEHTVVSVTRYGCCRDKKDSTGDATSGLSSSFEVWKPLTVHPGPRSVLLRPEFYVGDSGSADLGLHCISHSSLNRPLNVQQKLLRSVRSEIHDKKSPSDDDPFKVIQNISSNALKMTKMGVDLIKHILDTQIAFLGLTAVREQTPGAVPERISDFHAAGVRFLLFSKSNLHTTRTLGALLGLETGWNCLISLEETDKDAVPINMEGKAVLPAGIEGIKRHLREVDDVPLFVSLYANSSPPTIKQMFQILRKRGEIVTCIGSALRTCNFDLYAEVACSVSILLLPYPLCTDCHGRRSLGSCYHPMLLPEFTFSAALTSLSCALQSHSVSFKIMRPLCDSSLDMSQPYAVKPLEPYPEFLLQLLYSSFREARRIVASIEMCLLCYVLSALGLVASLLCLQGILGLPKILSDSAAILLLNFHTPIIATALFFNPGQDNIMVELPASPAYASRLQQNRRGLEGRGSLPSPSTSSTSSEDTMMESLVKKQSLADHLLTHGPKIVLPLTSTLGLSIWYLRQQLIKLAMMVEDSYEVQRTCFVEWSPIMSFFNTGTAACADAITHAFRQRMQVVYQVTTAIYSHEQVAYVLLCVFICTLAATCATKSTSLRNAFKTRNRKLTWVVLFMIAIALAKSLLSLAIYSSMKYVKIPNSWLWWLLSFIAPLLSALIIGVCERAEARRHKKQQKFLRLLFQTRLGMWSPK